MAPAVFAAYRAICAINLEDILSKEVTVKVLIIITVPVSGGFSLKYI